MYFKRSMARCPYTHRARATASLGRYLPRGFIGCGHKHKAGVVVHMRKKGVKVKGKVVIERLPPHLDAADASLNGINAETGVKAYEVVYTRFGHDADKQVYDLIRTVANDYAGRLKAVPAGQRLHQTGIAALGVAKAHVGMALHGLYGQGRHAQRVFVAGHFDDLGKAVFLLDFSNGQAGNIGLEGKNFPPHPDLKQALFITGMVYPASSM